MSHSMHLQIEFADKVLSGLYRASQSLRSGEDPKQVVEQLEQLAREIEAAKIDFEINIEAEAPFL